jgi:hypothetical protein
MAKQSSTGTIMARRSVTKPETLQTDEKREVAITFYETLYGRKWMS